MGWLTSDISVYSLTPRIKKPQTVHILFSVTHSGISVLHSAKCTLLSQEFEQHDRQEFERVPFGGHHMLEEQKQSVNRTRSTGGPNSISME